METALARAAALKALELDDQLPEAHAALGYMAENCDRDWGTAQKEFRRAIEPSPNSATGQHWYAECPALQGRFDEAFREIEIARRPDPLSLISAPDNGAFLYFSRQHDRALEQFRTVLEMGPNFPRAQLIASAFAQKGDFADAVQDLNAWQKFQASPWIWASEIYVAGASGRRKEAEEVFAELQRWNRREPVDPVVFAVAYIGLDRKDDAISSLRTAVKRHSPSLTALKVDPVYDPLRSDPRFHDLLVRVGLAAN